MTDGSPLLFVYGTLRPGHAPASVAGIIDQSQIIGPATFRGRVYDLHAYPGAVLDDSGADVVHGLILRLPTVDPWRRLDEYEGFDPADPAASLFVRTRCEATLADGRVSDVGVYVYNRDVAALRPIASGRYDPQHAMKRPVIGITMDAQDMPPGTVRTPSGTGGYYQLGFDYAGAIESAGGLPIAIPYRTHHALIPQFVDLLDGVLFTGGNDLDPALYGEEWHPQAVKVDPDRQNFELALLAEIEKRRTPALFVCMGCQVLNVHRGGSLTQFLPDDPKNLEHRRGEDSVRRHDITIDQNSMLGKVVGREKISANTYHKQAVKKLGRGLKVVATAPDGTIEALEDPSFPMMVATQWHPERLTDEPEHLAPFKLLVERAAKVKT